MSNKVTILDLPFINTTQEQFNQQLENRLKQHLTTFIVTANPEIAVYAHDNPEYKKLIQQADYITPDGIGVVKASQMINQPLAERITGFDTLTSLLKIANNDSLKVYLLGAKPDVVEKAVENVKKKYPHLKLVGYHDGYFKDEQPIVDQIKETQPDIVAVALGYPKQEEFIYRHKDLSPAVWMGVGGSFDVLSGQVKRAPKIFQNLHLEWFYRAATNPSRLGRLKMIPRFVKLVKKEHKQKNG